MPRCDAKEAREATGLTLEAAAKRLRYKVSTLQVLERTGRWPAHRLDEVAAVYGCDPKRLLRKPDPEGPTKPPRRK